MFQRGVVLPARCASSALSASASSFPADASNSISRSQASASNSRNQSRNAASSSVERCRTSFSIFSSLLTRVSSGQVPATSIATEIVSERHLQPSNSEASRRSCVYTYVDSRCTLCPAPGTNSTRIFGDNSAICRAMSANFSSNSPATASAGTRSLGNSPRSDG